MAMKRERYKNNPTALLAKITKLEKQLAEKNREAWKEELSRPMIASFGMVLLIIALLIGSLVIVAGSKTRTVTVSPYHKVDHSTPANLPMEVVIIGYYGTDSLWHDYDNMGRTISTPLYWRLR